MKVTKQMIKDLLWVVVWEEGSPSYIRYDGKGGRNVSLTVFKQAVDEWIKEHNYTEIKILSDPYHDEIRGADGDMPDFWVTEVRIEVELKDVKSFREKW